MILTNKEELAKKINSAVFPGLQGGPLMHVIAGKAVAFGEALKPEFKSYMLQVLDNANILSKALVARGYNIVTGGTDCHLLVVDLTNKGVSGKQAEEILEEINITCNKNTIPFDSKSPFVTSGIRLGTPAITTRGFVGEDIKLMADIMADVLDVVSNNQALGESDKEKTLQKVSNICNKYPIY